MVRNIKTPQALPPTMLGAKTPEDKSGKVIVDHVGAECKWDLRSIEANYSE